MVITGVACTPPPPLELEISGGFYVYPRALVAAGCCSAHRTRIACSHGAISSAPFVQLLHISRMRRPHAAFVLLDADRWGEHPAARAGSQQHDMQDDIDNMLRTYGAYIMYR
jgi:hypothetical protein